jgi:predicted phage-related endonuclease
MPTPLNISGSRAAAILGLSQYSTPLQVWLQIMGREFCEKHNYEYPEFEGNAATRWGSAFESAIIELAEERQKCDIYGRETFYQKDYITCHIDGAYLERDELHEGKTASSHYFYSAFGEPGTDRVPVEYQLQTQHQMICTGAEKVILSVLVFPKRVEEWEKMGIEIDNMSEFNKREWAHVLNEMGYFHQYTITAHPDLQKLMLEAYSDFWNNHVLTGTPPEPKNYTDIRSLVRDPVGTIIATPEINNLISEYKQIGSEISSTGTLAKRREQLKTQILNFSRTAGFVEDDESRDKWIIRSTDGKKLASYGKDSRGNFIFR